MLGVKVTDRAAEPGALSRGRQEDIGVPLEDRIQRASLQHGDPAGDIVGSDGYPACIMEQAQRLLMIPGEVLGDR